MGIMTLTSTTILLPIQMLHPILLFRKNSSFSSRRLRTYWNSSELIGDVRSSGCWYFLCGGSSERGGCGLNSEQQGQWKVSKNLSFVLWRSFTRVDIWMRISYASPFDFNEFPHPYKYYQYKMALSHQKIPCWTKKFSMKIGCNATHFKWHSHRSCFALPHSWIIPVLDMEIMKMSMFWQAIFSV